MQKVCRLMICSQDEKCIYKWEYYKLKHYGFEEIGCEQPQPFQNCITCYTGLLENTIKMYKNLLNLGHDMVQDPVFWHTIWQNSPRNNLFLFRWKHTWEVHLLHMSKKPQEITCMAFLFTLLSHKEEGQERKMLRQILPTISRVPKGFREGFQKLFEQSLKVKC